MIHDKYANMVKLDGKPMSRQQVYMVRRRAAGRCITCGRRLKTKNHCVRHALKIRERTRKLRASKSRLKFSRKK